MTRWPSASHPHVVALRWIAAVTTLLTLGLAGCGGGGRGGNSDAGSGSDASNGDTVELRDSESGKTVDLSPGDVVVVRLPSNPGTGFEWELDTTTDGVMVEVGRSFVAGPDDEGSPGQDVIRFEASAPGETTLALRYRRPWETGIEPERVVVFDFLVAG